MSFIYLASPYTSSSKTVMHSRYLATMLATATLLKSGKFVYSPIVHCHEMAIKHNMPKDFGFWKDYNYNMIDMSESVIVLMISGFEDSKGISYEMSYAASKGIPINFTTLEDIT